MLWTCSRDGHSGTLQGHWHWVDCRRAAFVRFWVADRSDSWSVLAFGAKWIISGWQRVQCGRPACITIAYVWHNLQFVHRLEDYHGTPIINLPGRNNRALTNILVHSCTWHAHTMAHLTWVQTAGGTMRTARSVRGNTNTRAEPNGRRWPRLRLLPGRLTASGNRVPGGDTGRTKLPNPRAPPALSDAE